jgi:hypothetical protein
MKGGGIAQSVYFLFNGHDDKWFEFRAAVEPT